MSISFADAATTITSFLGPVRLVAVSFLSAAPDGVTKFTGTTPSSCSFWRLASEGRAFYTEPSDHFNCPIGSYTHAIDLPASRGGELEQVLTLMSKIGYVRMGKCRRFRVCRGRPRSSTTRRSKPRPSRPTSSLPLDGRRR